MNNKFLTVLMATTISIISFGNVTFAEEKHSAKMKHEHNSSTTKGRLTEAGNDAFGTIQEVIKKLNSDKKTNWNKVNLEALRLHLQDMNDMTLNVEVVSQTPIPKGLKIIIRATTDRSNQALNRVFKAHPAQFKKDTGWDMTIKKENNKFIMTTTSNDSSDLPKIRGLGYIGLMAYGDHHQIHHWAMAAGKDPHNMHH